MKTNPANRLVSSCIRHMSTKPENINYEFILENEFARFKLWNHGFDGPFDQELGAVSSQLDKVLSYSVYHTEPTIILLANLVSCLLMREFAHVGNEGTRTELRNSLDHAIAIYPHIENTTWDTDSEETQESAIAQLRYIIDSLFELASPLSDELDQMNSTAIDHLMVFYKGLIIERFPNTPEYLIVRLAVGCRQYHESSQERKITFLRTEPLSTQNSSVLAHETGAHVHTAVPSISLTGDLSIQQHEGSVAESESSSYSINTDKPAMPKRPDSVNGYICDHCSEHQDPTLMKGISMDRWREHVFSDILPYMCIQKECSDGVKSFGSREDWINHLSSHKETNEPFMDLCPFCALKFKPGQSYFHKKHVGYHLEEIRLLSLPDHDLDQASHHGRGEPVSGKSSPLAGSMVSLNQQHLSREMKEKDISAWLSDDDLYIVEQEPVTAHCVELISITPTPEAEQRQVEAASDMSSWIYFSEPRHTLQAKRLAVPKLPNMPGEKYLTTLNDPPTVSNQQLATCETTSGKFFIRVQKVPLEWSEVHVHDCLRDYAGYLHVGPLLLFPSCYGSTQTALLTTVEQMSALKIRNPISIPVNHETTGKIKLELQVDCDLTGLTQLNAPEGEIVADIIAVTDFSSTLWESWMHTETHAMWLLHFLPMENDFKNVRILIYRDRHWGFDSRRDEVFLNELEKSRQSTKEKSRPIVFIGHGIGGITLLQALGQAKAKSCYTAILESTMAIYFIGTPYRELKVDQPEVMIPDLFWDGARWLESGPDYFPRQEITKILSKLRIFSIYSEAVVEAGPTSDLQRIPTGEIENLGMGNILLFSAAINLHSHHIHLSRKLYDLVKFRSPVENDYRTLVAYLRNSIREIVNANGEENDIFKCGGRAQGLCKAGDYCGPGMCRGDKRSKVMLWLSRVPFADHHTSARERRHKDSGNWLLEEREFLLWRNSSSSIIYLLGGVGCGKTTLASKIIDEFKPEPGTQHQGLAYFYCNSREYSTRTQKSIFRSLVKQLCLFNGQGGLPKSLLSEYNTDFPWGNGSAFSDLITELSTGYTQTIIIIDGLDECYRDREVILSVLNIVVHTAKNVKIFLTARHIGRQQMSFGRPTQCIDLNENRMKTTENIHSYIDFEIERLFQERSGFPKHCFDLKTEIISTLKREANAMFLWVHFKIRAISQEHTKEGVRNALAALPAGLRKIYRRLLTESYEAKPGTSYYTIEVLRWMLCVQGSCSVELLREAILGGRKSLLQEVLKSCSNLVMSDGCPETLIFAHVSVKQFLEELPEFSLRESHTSIAEACLTALISQPASPSLLQYSTLNWTTHLQLSCRGNQLKVLWKEFLKPSPAYQAWGTRIVKMDSNLCSATDDAEVAPPLWVACYYRLYDVIECLFDGADTNCRNNRGQTPLGQAAESGDNIVVQLLLERETVDINSIDEASRTPLSWAAYHGHQQVVQLLLEKEGVDINSVDEACRTPLLWAAYHGHPQVVQLLLEKEGVDINSVDEACRTPLSWAAYHGHPQVVQLLLEKNGVELNHRDVNGKTPLSLAAKKGHKGVVAMLRRASV